MKPWFKISFAVYLLSQAFTFSIAQSKIISIVPYPQKLVEIPGYFEIDKNTKIVLNSTTESIVRVATNLSGQLNKAGGFNFHIDTSGLIKSNTIVFHLIATDTSIQKEGYHLKVSEENILIESSSESGLFYGVQTLLQLLPVEMESKSLAANIDWKVPAVEVYDAPRFEWRGLHLDVSRHFMPVSFIKKYIDNMAMHKLNTFHWHLTDDQGWRIEIKKYPKLTETGAWRKETLQGHQYIRPLQFEHKQYGGYYTQDEIREVVKYAAERFITVVPEIDMPGHATAAIASYPYLGVLNDSIEVATRWGVFPNLYNLSDSTFQFLEDVLTEVIELFPSPYIHIGGDEARKEQWEQSQSVQSKIRALGLKDEKELQSYFIHRIEKFVNSKGRTIIGWDEILEGGLAPNALVMTWRGEEGGIHASRLGHKVIMTPGSHLYFDFYQGASNVEPSAIGGYTPLSKVYSYEPIPADLRGKMEADYIIGAQANVWTEYLKDEKDVEYMVCPRIAALSEVLWTRKENKDWNRFVKRIPQLLKRYEYREINYSNSVYNVSMTPVYNSIHKALQLSLHNELGYSDIRYTMNGASVEPDSPMSISKLSISERTLVKARVFKDGAAIGRETYQEIVFHKAYGARLKFATPYDTSAFVTNDWTLVDGIRGNDKNMYSDVWQRFSSDLDITIDLNEKENLRGINTSFVQIPGYAYITPVSFEIQISNDGKKYRKIPFTIDFNSKADNTSIVNYMVKMTNKAKARYVRVIAKNPGFKINEITGKKGPAILMVDEIVVE